MLVLAVDTSTAHVVTGVVEVARPQPGELGISPLDAVRSRAQRVVCNPRGHMELLVPHIVECLAEAGIRAEELGAVVVGVGPGPFTGLRVGMATGAAYADALRIPVHGIPSLAAISASARQAGVLADGESVLVATDARRREWYSATYRWDGPVLHTLREPFVAAPGDVLTGGLTGGADPGGAADRVLVAASIAEQARELSAASSPLLADWDAHPDPRGLVAAALSLGAQHRWGLSPESEGSANAAAVLAAGLDALRAPGEPLRALYLRRPDAKVPQRPAPSGAVDFSAWKALNTSELPSDEPQLCTLVPADAERLAELERALFPGEDPWSAASFRQEIAEPRTTYLGLRVSDGPQGLVAYAGLAQLGPAEDPEWEIHTIGIDPAYQGRGYGHLLMRELMARVDVVGGEVFLEVRVGNEPAIGLYRRYGFQDLGLRRGYYQPSGADALTMRRPSQTAPGQTSAGQTPAPRPLFVVGIETSCDETGVGIVELSSGEGGPRVVPVANAVASSMDEHAVFGGVVPEIASRAHLEAMGPTMQEALRELRRQRPELPHGTRPDAVCATIGPGLAGALMVGAAAAKAYAAAWSVPFYAVNHLGGHVAVEALEGEGSRPGAASAPSETQVTASSSAAAAPTGSAHDNTGTRGGSDDQPATAALSHAVALLVSGGHTQLLEVRGLGAPMRELGSTLDDAAGEAYDKVARLLGLGYPGGPVIDRLAALGNPLAIAFPRGMMRQGDSRYDYSFSGLKTAVARYVETAERRGDSIPVEDVCASFQEAVVDVLVTKALWACADTGARVLLLGGGVSANRRLREVAAQRCADAGVELCIPPAALCTDNGLMIAALGAQLIAAGAPASGLGVATDPSLEVEVPHVQ